jgi:3-hydroxyacyl-CoA dehydrogenase
MTAHTVGVISAGTMGASIAQIAAVAELEDYYRDGHFPTSLVLRRAALTGVQL